MGPDLYTKGVTKVVSERIWAEPNLHSPGLSKAAMGAWCVAAILAPVSNPRNYRKNALRISSLQNMRYGVPSLRFEHKCNQTDNIGDPATPTVS